MKIIFFDTETSGLPDFNKRARDPSQPHIVQFAALIYNEAGKCIQEENLIARPDGWTIPPEVAAIHGITQETALRCGIPEKVIAEKFKSILTDASLLVAHNLTFDKFILRIAMRRFELMQDSEDSAWKEFPGFCTMRATTNICRLPGPRGYKWPKLQEAYRYAFNESFDDAHNAMADVRACARLYFWLKEKGVTQ